MMRIAVTMMMGLLLSGGVARAADPAAVEEAKKHFTRSKELYDDGDFAGALNELERSYKAVPNYKLLYNMGQIHAQTQNHAAALRVFKRFLSEGGNDISDARRAEVLKEVDKLRTRVAELTITVSQPGAEVSVDDVVVGVSPLAEPVVVNVGKRKVSATLPDFFPTTRQIDVAGLDTPKVALELRPLVSNAAATTSRPSTEAPRVEQAAPPARFPVWLPWVGTALVGGATVVTGVFALQASRRQTALLGEYGVSRATLDAAVSQTRTLALVTDVLAGVTGAAAVSSLLFTLLRAPEPTTKPVVQLGVGVNTLLVTGAF